LIADESTPEGEEPDDSTAEQSEQSPSEGDAAAETPAAEEQPAADQEPAAKEEPASEEPAADEPASEEPAAEAPAAEEPAAEAPSRPAKQTPKAEKRDVVPGADLTPIAITEERELSAEERAALEAEEEERKAREAAQAAADADEEATAPKRTVTIAADAMIQATGKRKSSIARVVLRRGKGSIQVNDRTLEDYFPRANDQTLARQALVVSGYDESLEVKIRVHGGGISGQAGAVRHGIAKALCDLDPELRGELKRRGMLTRDARKKERYKAGLKKARKRPQFSKR